MHASTSEVCSVVNDPACHTYGLNDLSQYRDLAMTIGKVQLPIHDKSDFSGAKRHMIAAEFSPKSSGSANLWGFLITQNLRVVQYNAFALS
jgi:hypothetical protein